MTPESTRILREILDLAGVAYHGRVKLGSKFTFSATTFARLLREHFDMSTEPPKGWFLLVETILDLCPFCRYRAGQLWDCTTEESWAIADTKALQATEERNRFGMRWPKRRDT